MFYRPNLQRSLALDVHGHDVPPPVDRDHLAELHAAGAVRPGEPRRRPRRSTENDLADVIERAWSHFGEIPVVARVALAQIRGVL